MARRLAAIMFTDIVGYTAMTQADEKGALRLLREQEALVWPLLELHRGRKVKSMGDGLLIEFPDALDAVECAVDLQRHVQERNAREEATPLRLRIGIHLGDVEGVGTDILGDAVNIASRIEPLAEPGGVCVSEPVFVQIKNKVPYRLEELGPKTLKGVQESVAVYRVALAGVTEPIPSRTSAPPRIAVLPLTNISPDPKDEYFADGLTEELISVLSQIKGLRVISRTSVNQYKGTTKSVAQIGSELKAETVLEGSVRKAGDQLRIAVQLIDTRTDEHRWSQTYDRRLENVFAIQAEVAERTAEALKLQLLSSERQAIQERPTSNLVAYEAYLRGIQAQQRMWGRFTEEIDREVEKYLEDAIREDPGFAEAYARLAHHLMLVAGVLRPWKVVDKRARELVARAFELNPNSSEAHRARGFLADLDGEWDRAEAEFQHAIALNPSNSEAHRDYSWLLWVLQRFDEEEKQILTAVEQDPLNPSFRGSLAGCYAAKGDLRSAIASAEKNVRDYPDNPGYRCGLAFCYALAGRSEDALRTVEPLASTSNPPLWLRALRGRLLAWIGLPDEARAFLADWYAGRVAGIMDVSTLATLHIALGENDRALALLEENDRQGDRTWWFNYLDEGLDPVRDDPRFMAMLQALNLPTKLSRQRWFPKVSPRA
jgi:TolB-like protein